MTADLTLGLGERSPDRFVLDRSLFVLRELSYLSSLLTEELFAKYTPSDLPAAKGTSVSELGSALNETSACIRNG